MLVAIQSLHFAKSGLLITPEHLVCQVITKMNHLGDTRPDAGNTNWTPEVKGYLRDIANALKKPDENLNIDVIYTKVAPGTREWPSTRPGLSENVVAEALRTCIGEDFSKLLVVKSPLKLMIFCTGKVGGDHEQRQAIVFEEIDRNLEPYCHHIAGEHYIFIDAASNGHRRGWLQTVDEKGVLSSRQEVDFRPTA